MILFTAILPPRQALDAVIDAMAAVESPAEPTTTAPASPRGTSRWRRTARETEPVDPPAPVGPEFDILPVGQVHLPIARFGNTTPVEVARLTKALGAAASAWVPPTVRIAGATILEDSGDWSVAIGLRGDLEPLETIAKEVNRAAQGLGYLLDRRSFRPLLSVASVQAPGTGAHLQALVAALESFEGDPWTIGHLSLLQESWDPAASPREVARLPLHGVT